MDNQKLDKYYFSKYKKYYFFSSISSLINIKFSLEKFINLRILHKDYMTIMTIKTLVTMRNINKN